MGVLFSVGNFFAGGFLAVDGEAGLAVTCNQAMASIKVRLVAGTNVFFVLMEVCV